MRMVRVGVIGLGWFGETHVDAYRGVRGAEVTAVCTRRFERAQEIKERYGVKKAYTDYNELLADPDIDMVDICTHGKDRAGPMVAALGSEKHVFLEKPMATTMEDLDSIMQAAENCTKNVMVGHICRFLNEYSIAHDEIASGKIGDIVSIYARRNVCSPVAYNQLLNLSSILGDCVHDIDLMNWYTGSKAETVFGMARKTTPDLPNDDIGWVNIVYNNDTVAVSESNWNMPPGSSMAIDAKMEVIGTKGIIYIEAPSNSLIIDSGTKRELYDTVAWPLVRGQRMGCLNAELQYFVDCVINDEKPTYVPLEDSYEAAKVCIKAIESAGMKEAVHI